MIKVTYILQTHFYTLHKYITNEDDKHYLNVIHVCALINISYNKTSKCIDVENYIFLHTTCHNSVMFQSILIIFS